MIFSLLFTIFSLLFPLQNLHKILLHVDVDRAVAGEGTSGHMTAGTGYALSGKTNGHESTDFILQYR